MSAAPIGGDLYRASTATRKAVGAVSDTARAAKKAGGGAYKDVRAPGMEAHHMPAKSVSPLSDREGPAISMTPEDHRQTASWGRRDDARAYRSEQERLIQEGKFKEAQQMDVDDVRAKFGDKYDKEIDQMLDYTDELERQGRI